MFTLTTPEAIRTAVKWRLRSVTPPNLTVRTLNMSSLYVAANVAKINASRAVTHRFAGNRKVEFKTMSGSTTLSEHVFTSGVPSPELNCSHGSYIFGNTDDPEQKGAEVVIEI
jgi:hypothetical protein